MTLCRLLVMDFTEGLPDNAIAFYDELDIEFGISYAEDLLAEGYRREPFYGFGLEDFSAWCRQKLVCAHTPEEQR